MSETVAVALCLTYRRPAALRNALACFVNQTHYPRRLLVLDDAGLYRTQFPAYLSEARGPADAWSYTVPYAVVSATVRYPDIEAKYTAAEHIALGLWPDAKLFVRWDDDDVYLPGYMSRLVNATNLAESPHAIVKSASYHALGEGATEPEDCRTLDSFAWTPQAFHRKDSEELITDLPGHYVKRYGRFNYNVTRRPGEYRDLFNVPFPYDDLSSKPMFDPETRVLYSKLG